MPLSNQLCFQLVYQVSFYFYASNRTAVAGSKDVALYLSNPYIWFNLDMFRAWCVSCWWKKYSICEGYRDSEKSEGLFKHKTSEQVNPFSIVFQWLFSHLFAALQGTFFLLVILRRNHMCLLREIIEQCVYSGKT